MRKADASSYAFCAPNTRSAGKWHLRRLTRTGHLPGGGIDTASLCDQIRVGGGFDLLIAVTERHLVSHTCPKCLAIYRSET